MFFFVILFSIHLGNKVDGPENGQPPGPWEMQARTPMMFEDDSSEISIPHTHYVKVCIDIC